MLFANAPVESAALVMYKFRDEEANYSTETFAKRLGLLSQLREVPGLLATGMRRFKLSFLFEGIRWNELRVGMYGFEIRTNLGSCSIRSNTRGLLQLTPSETMWYYEDPSSGIFRAELLHLGKKELDQIAAAPLPVSGDNDQGVCLVGEYSNSARDNGFALFSCLRAQPIDGLTIKYVIEADNPDGLKPDGRDVLEYGSPEHLLWCRRAEVVAFTHHAHYVLPGVIRYFGARKFRTKKRFFLQHGITALKASMDAYKKRRTRYDAINVCSEFERDLVATACRFPPEEIPVAGFPRHDLLLKKAAQISPTPNQVLVFPTWRRGLEKIDSDSLLVTEFYTKWTELLRKLRNSSDLRIAFVLHPTLRRHSRLFEDHVDVLDDAVNFQNVLASSSALITDYSSVCFEALYLGRPVFFFTFDEVQYGFAKQAMIDIETQLPGPRHTSADSMSEAVISSHRAGWPPPGNTETQRFFAHRDDQNSARCGAVIMALADEARRERMETAAVVD